MKGTSEDGTDRGMDERGKEGREDASRGGIERGREGASEQESNGGRETSREVS